MQKTLGGDRLGSGSKMKVELHNYERSTHDLGYLWRSTMSAGTLVPFLCEVALPGDTFDINLGCEMLTHPTEGPLFASSKVQLDVFQAPIRLYQAQLHNNTLGIGRNMSQVKLPQIEFLATKFVEETNTDLDNSQINPSSVMSYLGLRGIGLQISGDAGSTQARQFNAVPILALWEIYKNYYANKQEEIGAVIHTGSTITAGTLQVGRVRPSAGTLTNFSAYPTIGAIEMVEGDLIRVGMTNPINADANSIMLNMSPAGQNVLLADIITGPLIETATDTWDAPYDIAKMGPQTVFNWRTRTAEDIVNLAPNVVTFPLSNIDEMRKAILAHWTNTPFLVNTPDLEPYNFLYQLQSLIPNILSSQEGLPIKTYQSDLFNNWLRTENIEDISTITAIDTSAGSFTVDSLIMSKKIYNLLNRINVSGGSYDDWIDAVYTNDKYRTCETPMYMGGLIKELVFQEVVSNSASETQPLGTLAGKGVLSKKHKGGTIVVKVDEPSYIIGLISITPRLDYSQGNKWDVNLKTMDDLHKPALDEIGFQELITEQLAWWDTQYHSGGWQQKSAGKQPAWLNYMTNVNQTRGNFAIANNEMFMTNNRRYEPEPIPASEQWQIADLTTYIDPTKFNFIFAETALDAQNYWAQIAVDITARRKMSAKVMPNL